MKYYKDNQNQVYAYESDGSQDAFIKPDLTPISEQEALDIANPPAPPYVPQQVTRAQGKAALIVAGLWVDVVDYVNNIEDTTEKSLALVALNDTTNWQRNSPFLNSAATSLGLSSEDLDNLFIQAASIEL